VDARLTAEQADLRAAAAKLADDLGPRSVHDIHNHDRTERIEAAVAATAWRSLRSDGASGVEIALVTEEFARGLVDAPFLGPLLADALLPGTPATIAVNGRAPDARGIATGVALDNSNILAGALGDAAVGVDLTRHVAAVAGPLEAAGEISAEAAERWRALAIVVTAADLLGAARGAHALAVDYAKIRAQYGHVIGGYQAVSHPLAEGLALIEGMTSIVRYAAWAVDEAGPGEALRLARVAKVYCARSARAVCETAVQVHGGIGNTWECLAHVYLRRVLTATELFGVRLEETVLAGETVFAGGGV
jgi:acyl-CoA dehydrogenase-like protein